MGLSLFKLEKLKISAYKDVSRSGLASKTFEAMFNPTSFSQSYSIDWHRGQGINASASQLAYTRSRPSELTLDLILDGTGVNEFSLLGPKSVKDRVKRFLDVTYRYNGNIHEPNYLLVEWGSLKFACRLSAVDIKYTLFDRDGTPLRAELHITLLSDKGVKKRAKEEGKTSPDLTHARTVRRGDTLPLLTTEIYGSPDYYLDVAAFNNLDDFRNLSPGQQLLFPPLSTFRSDEDASESAEEG